MTKEDWLRQAKIIELVVDGEKLEFEPRVFASGNIGYGLSTKARIGGHKCQATGSIVVIGSKAWSEGDLTDFQKKKVETDESPSTIPAE